MKDTQKSQLISTDLRQIAVQAKQQPARVFTSLAHRMDVDFLTEAYHRVRKGGAVGLSGVTSKDYKRNLTDNLTELHRFQVNLYYTLLGHILFVNQWLILIFQLRNFSVN